MIPLEKRIIKKSQLKEWLQYERKKYHYNRFNLVSEERLAFKYNVLLRKSEYYSNTGSILKYIFLFKLKKYQLKYLINIPIKELPMKHQQ